MKDKACKDSSVSTADSGRPESLTRRSLLRAGASAVPVVLTLQSGEALARSSNLIGAAPAGTRNTDGKALCLDTSTSSPIADKYDLHDPGYATVNSIPDADYFPLEAGRSVDPTNADAFCNKGGTMQYHSGGWHKVDLPTNGIVVSANSLSSVSSRVDIFVRDWM